MPGAFAHITAANEACDTTSLMGMDMPVSAKLALSQNPKYIELGCVSPDYPYLAIADSKQNKWADLMHYERTGELIKTLATACKTLPDSEQGRLFAWLCGFVSHVIADITIHPVVERRVGPYAQNKTAHRECEMNQDAYIWQRLNLGEIGVADHVRIHIGECAQNGRLDSAIQRLWGNALLRVHKEYAQQAPPEFDKWHDGFQTVVDKAEEGYRLFTWARHVAADIGLMYPRPDEVEVSFIEELDTPAGFMHYDQIFDLAVANIRRYIGIVGRFVYEGGNLDDIKNWNLDDGKDAEGELTAWQR
ncbi:zinc dependent phospholipase C family protein [Bowmanella pacifica]|uniref:Phospholipase C/D domain-containing protein n=1 Tax=Bowmanella pacifica TaxID=502051 RepID=A0A918DLL9_9ALTE|nr:zinc dependent phospholipase C family protein [Bowmanella pacifica]GGO74047.1 hypothetical protein GCM10010982_35940 [Bowmanella pacifica]